VAYIEAGDIQKAVAAYGMIVSKYPKSAQAKDSLLEMAKISEKLLDFDRAASYFAEFAKRHPEAKEAPITLARSCSLLIAIDSPKALASCGAYIKSAPQNSIDEVQKMIVNAEREKQHDLMVNLIRNHYLSKYKLTPNQKIIAYYRILRSAESGPLAQDAIANIERTFAGSSDAVSGEALRYVGSIVFRRATGAGPKFQAVRLAGGSVDRLAASIGNKEKALAALEETYQKVVKTKDSYWGVAALYQLGNASEQFAADLQDPPEINGAPKADVIKELLPRVKLLKERALKYYLSGQEIMSKYSVYNEWSVKTISGILRVKGDKVAFDDWVIAPDFLGAEVPQGMVASLRGGR